MEQLRNYMKNVGVYLFKNKGEKMTGEQLKEKILAFAPLLISAVTLLNTFLSLKGLPCLTIADTDITTTVSAIASIVAVVWTWWTNNNVTPDAQVSQKVLDELKNGSITTEQVEQFVEDNTAE